MVGDIGGEGEAVPRPYRVVPWAIGGEASSWSRHGFGDSGLVRHRR